MDNNFTHEVLSTNSLSLKVIIDDNGVSQRHIIPEYLKISFDDLQELQNLLRTLFSKSGFGIRNWNKFLEETEKAGKGLGNYEKAIRCIRAAQLALDKDSNSELGSLSVLLAVKENELLFANIIDIESKAEIKKKQSQAESF